MGEALGAVTGRASGVPLVRTTYELIAPAWSTRTVDDDPGAPFFNDGLWRAPRRDYRQLE